MVAEMAEVVALVTEVRQARWVAEVMAVRLEGVAEAVAIKAMGQVLVVQAEMERVAKSESLVGR